MPSARSAELTGRPPSRTCRCHNFDTSVAYLAAWASDVLERTASLTRGPAVNAFSPALAPHGLGPAQAREPSRAYVQARRHSGRVRLLKFVIPAGVAVASLLILAVAFYNPFGKVGLTLGPISVSGSKIAMQAPRLTGFKKDDRPYEVTAIAAYQDIRKPNVIELKDMNARLVIDQAGAKAHLVSSSGVFDTQKEWLELKDDIRITTDRGEEALLRSASVDFKANTIVSREPVRITTAQATIEAAGLNVAEGGKTISFSGRVHAVVRRMPGESDSRQGAAPARYTQAEPAGARP